MCSVNNFSSKKGQSIVQGKEHIITCLSYASALCLIVLSFLRYGHLRYASLRHAFLRHAFLRVVYLRYAYSRYSYLRYVCLRYGYLRYSFLRCASLRYASFRDDHLQNRLVAIQLLIDAFMIWTILFQILIIEFCHRYTSIPYSGKVAVSKNIRIRGTGPESIKVGHFDHVLVRTTKITESSRKCKTHRRGEHSHCFCFCFAAFSQPSSSSSLGSLQKDDADCIDDATKQWFCTLCTCVLHFGTFLWRYLLNDDVK